MDQRTDRDGRQLKGDDRHTILVTGWLPPIKGSVYDADNRNEVAIMKLSAAGIERLTPWLPMVYSIALAIVLRIQVL